MYTASRGWAVTNRTRAVLLIAFGGTGCLGQQPSQPEPVVLKTETSAVVVDVIVTDHKGRHVPDLSRSDFRVFEDKTEQQIASFAPPPPTTNQPGAARRQPAGPAVTSPTSEPPVRPQLITLLLDTGDLQLNQLKPACASASKFAEKTITEGNLVALYWVDTSLHLAVPFTRDKRSLLGVLKKMSTGAGTGRLSAREGELDAIGIADLLARVPAEQPVVTPGTKNEQAAGKKSAAGVWQEQRDREALQQWKMAQSWLVIASSFQARAVFMALRALAQGYQALPGRKTIVLFSSGFRHSKLAEAEMQAVVESANRASVAIYVMDAAGLTTGRTGSLLNAEVQRPDISDGARGSQRIATLRDKDAQSLGINRFEWAQTVGSDLTGDLGTIADETGGFLAKNASDLGPALDRVEDDAGHFYTLVYYTSNHNYDGAFRQIKVELAGHEYHVRYRQGYWALPPQREAMMTPAAMQLLAAVESGERKAAFVPHLNAAEVMAADGRSGISAAVSMPGRLVRFEQLQNELETDVSVFLVARDEKGVLLSVQERYANVRIPAQEHEEFAARTFNLQGHVSLPELRPVSLQAMVLLEDGTLGISPQQKLKPPAGSLNLALTNLVLSDHQEDSQCITDPLDPLCVKGVRVSMPSERQFNASTKMILFFAMRGLELSGNGRPSLGVAFRLSSASGTEPVQPERFLLSGGRDPHSLLALGSLDLQSLSPGQYALEVTVHDKIQEARVIESAAFEVR